MNSFLKLSPQRKTLTWLLLILAALTTNAIAAPMTLSGSALQRTVRTDKLPVGTMPGLYDYQVVGDVFHISTGEITPQALTIEMGFVETEATGEGQRAFGINVNGMPLNARLDVWKEAGGAFRPWVLKVPYPHTGGALTFAFAGLGKPALLSYIRITNAAGQEIAFSTAKSWGEAGTDFPAGCAQRPLAQGFGRGRAFFQCRS